MADIRMPVTHWVARLTILFALASIVFAATFSGALASAAGWATDCGSRVAGTLWAPLLGADDPENPLPPRPVRGCWTNER